MSELLRKVTAARGSELDWCVVGERGAIHVHCDIADFSNGGIEIHSVSPLFEGHRSHNSSNCWLIGCQCYHDGSSLQWSESISRWASIYLFDQRASNWWSFLANEYASRFGVKAHVDDRWPIYAERLNSERVRLAAASLMEMQR
jgi:hypothetical protein